MTANANDQKEEKRAAPMSYPNLGTEGLRKPRCRKTKNSPVATGCKNITIIDIKTHLKLQGIIKKEARENGPFCG